MFLFLYCFLSLFGTIFISNQIDKLLLLALLHLVCPYGCRFHLLVSILFLLELQILLFVFVSYIDSTSTQQTNLSSIFRIFWHNIMYIDTCMHKQSPFLNLDSFFMYCLLTSSKRNFPLEILSQNRPPFTIKPHLRLKK